MNVLPRFRFGLSASAVLVAGAILWPGSSRAGTLQVRDLEHVLSSEDTARLRAVVSSAPFDGRFVVTNEYPDTQDLSRYVGSLVNEPNVVVIGLDPPHHHVQVHFGNGDRVPRSAWPTIEAAGTDAFRHSDWEEGAAAIFQAASRAVVEDPGHGLAAPPVARAPSLFGPGLLGLLLVGGLGLALLFARRRSAYGVMGGPGYGGVSGYGGPGYPMPPQSGVGPLGGGLIGAGLGGLAGYELGKYEGEREDRNREPSGGGDDRGGSFDAGGGGSGWDDAGGGGGFDGGGGDSGGGSDF